MKYSIHFPIYDITLLKLPDSAPTLTYMHILVNCDHDLTQKHQSHTFCTRLSKIIAWNPGCQKMTKTLAYFQRGDGSMKIPLKLRMEYLVWCSCLVLNSFLDKNSEETLPPPPYCSQHRQALGL